MTDDQPDKQHPINDRSESIAHSCERSLVDKSRCARIAAYDDAHVGVCIYLTVPDLHELGIDLGQTESDVVEYTIDDDTSKLAIRPRNR